MLKRFAICSVAICTAVVLSATQCAAFSILLGFEAFNFAVQSKGMVNTQTLGETQAHMYTFLGDYQKERKPDDFSRILLAKPVGQNSRFRPVQLIVTDGQQVLSVLRADKDTCANYPRIPLMFSRKRPYPKHRCGNVNISTYEIGPSGELYDGRFAIGWMGWKNATSITEISDFRMVSGAISENNSEQLQEILWQMKKIESDVKRELDKYPEYTGVDPKYRQLFQDSVNRLFKLAR